MTSKSNYVWPCVTANDVYGRIYLSYARALELAELTATLEPTRVSPKHVYYDGNGEPSDIVATILFQIGYTNPGHLQPGGVARRWDVLHEEVLLGDLRTKAFFIQLIKWTDTGRPWIKVVELAKRWMERHQDMRWEFTDEERLRDAFIASGAARVA